MSATVIAERSEWLNGPGLVKWLEANGLNSPDLQLGFLGRRIRDWRAGSAAEVFVADKVLTKLSLHLSQIPDDLWLEGKPTNRRYTDGEREEMARRIAAGESLRDVARAFGCHRDTVQLAVQAARAEA